MSELDNKIETRTIASLLGLNFFIPNYQRGYRWTSQQVTDLLKDVYEFVKKDRKQDEFYCLQPIVVKKMSPEDLVRNSLDGEWYEVIDGQQRLTTIKIILKYLIKRQMNEDEREEFKDKKIKIKYATRKDSEKFFDKLGEEEIDANGNIDYTYITDAYRAVESWFKSLKEHADKRAICDTFTCEKGVASNLHGTIQVVWYESNEKNPENVFRRLNIGKIPLTNAELIKALFLNGSNFKSEKDADYKNSRYYLKQLEIANMWDKVEYTLHDERFWLFIHQKEYSNPTRIDFIFDLIKDKDVLEVKKLFGDNLDNYEKELGTDSYKTFRYFYFYLTKNMEDKEKLVDDDKEKLINDCWKVVKSIFDVFVEWYNDIELYHYVGFLVQCDSKLKIAELYDEWNSWKCKKDFVGGLKNRINHVIASCRNLDQQYEYSEDTDNDSSDEKKDKYPDKTKVRPLLLLHNIQTVINQNKNFEGKKEYGLGFYYKFPFHLYALENWNIEHIYPETTNDMDDLKEQKEWLVSLYNSDVPDKLKKTIISFLNTDFKDKEDDCRERFKEIYNKYFKKLERNKQILNEQDRNKVWNFVLLDEHTNKSYGNAIFSVKRRCILGKDQGEKWVYNPNHVLTKWPKLDSNKTNEESQCDWCKSILDFGLTDEKLKKEITTFLETKFQDKNERRSKFDKIYKKIESDDSVYTAFVPVSTKNVFMKSYTPGPNDLSEWTKYDAECYLNNIENVLKSSGFNIEREKLQAED